MRSAPLALLVCAVVVAAACQSPAPSVAPPTASVTSTLAAVPPVPASSLAADQILRLDIGEPKTLDPTLADGPEVGILHALHRSLVDLGANHEVVPELARSWEISDDGRTLTFHLRDARYSNGDPILAGDFVYSWRRLADPRTEAYYSYVMRDLVGGPELLAMSRANPAPSDDAIDAALDDLGVVAPDQKTIVVHLNRPTSYFLSAVSLWALAPLQERWISSANATAAANYVSSGPFILDAWAHNDQIVLKRNPNWWGDLKPTLTEIDMTIATVDQAQVAYEAGEIDMTTVPSEDVQRVKDDPALRAEYREVPQFQVQYESFNNFMDPNVFGHATRGPTANRDFRIALTQAIDKQALIDTADAGLGQAANSFIMPGIDGYQPDLNPYPFDIESAGRHMTDALKALGKKRAADVGKLKLGYVSDSGHETEVAFLAESWRQAFGLETEQIGSDYGVFKAQVTAGDYDISVTGWGADYPHPSNQLNGLFTCGGAENDAHYCNPAFDALLDKAAAELDHDEQVATYDDAQTLLVNDAAFLPVRFVVTPYEVKTYVSGLRLPDDSYDTIQILTP